MKKMEQSDREIWITHRQAATLDRMPRHRILGQLNNGAVIIVFAYLEAGWTVIDLDGKIHEYQSYMAASSECAQHRTTASTASRSAPSRRRHVGVTA
jgi:hypothetical protein